MTQFQPGVGKPIFNAQEFLRIIAQTNENLVPIVPDGIFGVETKRAVSAFQAEYGLPETGEIDNDTWDKIVEVYTEVKIYTTPVCTQLFPTPDHVIREGDRADFHYPVQAIIYALSKRFDNIDGFDEISDLHSGGVVNTTKQIQALMEHDCDGEIDIKCWGAISRLYENVVAKETFDIAFGENKQPRAKPEPVKDVPDANSDRFVPREEFEEDMRRETERYTVRNGVITPRLEAENTEDMLYAEGEIGNGADVGRSVQAERQSESTRKDVESTIRNDREENMKNVQPAIQKEQNVKPKPKMPPLRWNFR